MASDWTDLQSSNPADVGYGGTNVDVWTLAGTSAAQSLPSVENLLESNLLFGSAETFGPGVSTFMTAASAGDTFSGTADHPIAVKVSGSSNGSADLSTQAESKAASAQLVTDPAVQSTSATSNAVSLATDSSLQPSLSVDAANPAHVTFTVSGLEPDYSGTVTFTDPSGTQDVVPIESNGAYSANLSNLTNGTITYLLSVSDPAGNVITVDPPLNFGDGSANAPAGTPQLPNLLSGYAATPSWNVAGVNYYVGDPAGTTLKNPDTINMAGVTVDTSTDVVTITGNNITLSGYDFSLNGGWQVYVAGNNDTIEDCNFEVGSNGQAPISIGVNGQTASNTTIEYNTINGNGISVGGGGLIECSGIGTTTIEYNSITNAYNEAIVLGNTTSSAANYVVQYNLIENTGLGYTEGAHGDWIQTFNAPGDTSSIEINYNTFVQNVAGQSTQGLSLQSANITQGPVLSETVENNTMVALDSGTVNYAIIVDTTNLNGSATVANNYIGPTGLTYGWSFFGQYNNPDGSYNGTLTSFNNVDMATGAYYPQSGTSVTKVVSSPSTGNEVPGNTITLTLDFSSPVAVTGTPTLTLNDGGTATYKSGSGTSALTFNYTVGSSDSAVSNLAITAVNLPNGATINSGGTAANLTNALTTLWGLQIGSASGSPPAAPVISTGVANSNESVTLTGTAPDGSTVTVSDGGATALGTATASSTGAWSFTTADLSAGSYAFTATDTTSAGTSAASSAFDVTVKPPPPAAPVMNTGVANSNESVTLTGTAPDGSTVTVSDGGATALGTATASSTGAWSFTTADLPAGSYAFTATDTTSAGTSAASSAFDVTVKSSPPAAPVISTGVANSNESVTLTGTAPDGSTVTVSDGGATALGTATASSTGAWSFTTADLSAGSYAFTATDTTSAGTSAASGAFDVTVKPPPPAAPVINTGVANSNESVTLTGTAPGGSTVTVSDGGATALGTATASSTGAWSFTTADLPAGSYAFTATDTTSAGTSAASSAFDVTVKSPPSGPTLSSIAESPASGYLDAGKTVMLTLTLNEAVTVSGTPTLTLNDGGTATYTNGTGTDALTFSYTVGAGQNTSALAITSVNLPNGATITNGTGQNASLSLAGLTQTGPQIDTTTPTVSSIAETPPSGDLDAGKTVTYTIDMSEPVTVNTAGGSPTLALNDGGTAIYTSGSGTKALTFVYTVAAGQNTPDLQVTEINLNGGTISDGAGNAANLSLTGLTQGSPQIDTTAPNAPVISSDTINTDVVTLTGSAEANSTVTVYNGTAELGTAAANSSGAWSYTTGTLASGNYAFTAKATDAAGNVSTASSAVDVTVNTPANLVTNGGFETGNLSGWTLGGNSTSTTYGPEIFITPDAESGQDAAALGSVNSDGTLSQTLQTTAGQQYTLSFWLANEGSGPNNFTVYWNGTAVTTLTNAPAQNYTEYSFTVTATGSTSTLKFAAEQNPSQWDLDNVSVTPVGTLTPAITAIGESPSSGDLNAGKTGTITLDLNETVTVAGGTPTLTLNDGGTATYTSGSGTDALTFSYTVGAGQNTADLAATAVNLNGATIKDGATAANLSLTGLTQAGPQIDTVAPPPPVISTDQKNGVRTVALTGTAEADSTVTVYDNGKDLGTTTANASGAWTFTTGRLARGSQVFTATDTDAAGNTSAPSNPIDPIIGGAAPQNATHNAVISALSSYIASSFPEASVSHVVNIVSDALKNGNQSPLTNPHHA